MPTLTPRLKGTLKRIHLNISDVEAKRVTRGLGFKGIVADLNTGKNYEIFGASCGLTCLCDAIAVEVASAFSQRKRRGKLRPD